MSICCWVIYRGERTIAVRRPHCVKTAEQWSLGTSIRLALLHVIIATFAQSICIQACDIILQVKHNSKSRRKYFTIGPACGISKNADRDHCAKCGSLHFSTVKKQLS